MHLDRWTLLFQAINLLVLLGLLRWLFYRPLLGVIDARQQAIEAEQTRAAAAVQDAGQRVKALADERAKLDGAREQALQSARAAIERERAAALQEARQAADATLADAREQTGRQRREAAQALFGEASALATALARRLLAPVSEGADDARFVGVLLDRLQATPGEERTGWFATDAPRTLVLTSAHALGADTRERAKGALQAALGDDVRIDFSVDATLIAGAELRFPHGVLAQHWAAELAAAREQMRQAAELPA